MAAMKHQHDGAFAKKVLQGYEMAVLVRHCEQGHFFADLRRRPSCLGRFQAANE